MYATPSSNNIRASPCPEQNSRKNCAYGGNNKLVRALRLYFVSYLCRTDSKKGENVDDFSTGSRDRLQVLPHYLRRFVPSLYRSYREYSASVTRVVRIKGNCQHFGGTRILSQGQEKHGIERHSTRFYASGISTNFHDSR